MTSAKFSASFQISQPIETVFPLFSPEGEKYWVPDWDYVNIMGTTEIFEDYVFLTRAHDHGAAVAIWLVKTYQPNETFVQFYRVEPDEKVGVVSIKCSPVIPEATSVLVSYEYIALASHGDEFIAKFTQAAYDKFIADWKVLLDRYFHDKSGN